MNTPTLMQAIPWLGWLLLLLGWAGQRPSVQKHVQAWTNKVTVFGSHNHIQNEAEFGQSALPAHEPTAQGTSALERWSQWATVAGLLVSLWPLLTNSCSA